MRGGVRDVGDWIKAAVMAAQLMTKLPLPFEVPWSGAVARRSIAFYPMAGALVGAVVGVAFWAMPQALPPAPSAAFVVALWVWATGALHLDGWMDTADALGSYRSRERMLEIMKDPRVGAFGATAGTLLLLCKTTLVFSLLELAAAGGPNVGAALAAVPVVARMAVPWAVVRFPYAGGSGGMGAALREARTRHAALSIAVGFVSAAALLAGFGSGDPELLLPALAAGAALAFAFGWAACRYVVGRLGGLTGDTYGAVIEGTELLLLVALVALGQP